MPCYNEAASVERVVARVLASPYTAELVVVDDGSTDGTRDILSRLDDPRIRLTFQPANAGKGAALRTGFAEIRFPYAIVQDADDEYDPADYAQVLAPLLDGRADVVFGSRFNSAHAHRVLYYWHSVGNRLLTTMSNMFTNLNLTDMETCYKAFRREVIESLDIEEDRFGFEPEITAKVAAGGWRIYEVSIGYSGRTYAEGKKIGWRDGVHAVGCIVRYSPVGRARRRRKAARRRVTPPPDGKGSDDALAGTLENLDEAVNYTRWIYSMMEPHLGTRVLEVGAGHGTMTNMLHDGRELVVTDVSPRCVALLRERFSAQPGIEVLEADIVGTPGAGGFDGVVMVNVLEHVADDKAALRRLYDAMVPGGRLVVLVPAFEALYSDFDRRIGHHRRYEVADLRTAVGDAGFEVVEVRYVNSVGAVAWWLVARQLGWIPTRRWSALTYDQVVVPVLRRVETRWSPPFGQSLLCVARRPTS